MRQPRRRPASSPLTVPTMLFELTLASWETIARRTLMMAQGTCSTSEYHRMVLEKTRAVQHTALTLMTPHAIEPKKILDPWHRGATANARRLRRQGG